MRNSRHDLLLANSNCYKINFYTFSLIIIYKIKHLKRLLKMFSKWIFYDLNIGLGFYVLIKMYAIINHFSKKSKVFGYSALKQISFSFSFYIFSFLFFYVICACVHKFEEKISFQKFLLKFKNFSLHLISELQVFF